MEHLLSLAGYLPFSWAHYQFMQHALAAVLIVSPLFALMGTMVVSHRLAFFSDVLGHSALTGVALGVVLGVQDVSVAMAVFIAAVALLFSFFRRVTSAAQDTVLGVFFAVAVATGVVVLSKGGGFSKFTQFLIGDILAVTPGQVGVLAAVGILVAVYWFFFGNSLMLLGVSPVMARSRGVKAIFVETTFLLLLAMVVAVSIKLVGILIINSLLVLPAAAARLVAANSRQYSWYSIVISTVAGVAGLVASYYAGTASGATIVLFCAGMYAIAALAGRFLKRRYA